jgi:hypothetical protein
MMKMLEQLKKITYEISVLLFFVVTRLPSLGHDIFNTDVWKWKARTFDFGQGVFTFNFEQTIQKYHPGVILMWIGSVGVKFYNFFFELLNGFTPPDNTYHTIFGLHFTQKLFVIIVIGLTLSAIFYVLRRQFSLKYALIFSFLIIFEPFFVALSRVFHLEGLMSIFMLASFVWFYFYLKHSGNKKYLAVSGLFAGLAFLTKTSSLFLIPFFCLISFFECHCEGKSLKIVVKKSLKPVLNWFLIALAVFIILWPGFWVSPIKAIQTMYSGVLETGVSESHDQIFMGRYVEDPGPLFYLVVFAYRSSPFLLVGLVGYLFIFSKVKDKEIKKFVLYAFLFSLLYFVMMTIPSKKLDRYLLPSIISGLLVAGVFYEWLIEKVKKIKPFEIKLFILFIPAMFTIFSLHPDYFSYYNPMFGGLSKGIYVIEPKWLIGREEIIEFFEEKMLNEGYVPFEPEESLDAFVDTRRLRDRLVIGFPEKYYTQIWPFVNEIGARATIKDITAQAVNSKYFVYPVWDDTSDEETRFKLVYVWPISVRGVELYRVYMRVE